MAGMHDVQVLTIQGLPLICLAVTFWGLSAVSRHCVTEAMVAGIDTRIHILLHLVVEGQLVGGGETTQDDGPCASSVSAVLPW